MKKKTLWTRNYTLLMLASTLGSIGGIAGSYAMSFLVFDETGSTLAAGLLSAIQIIPHFLLPILAAPVLDRLPRKPFLVGGDLIGGLLYGCAGLYLNHLPFSYGTYLCFSIVINCINSFDSLAFNCIFPKTLPEGFEEKGYTVSAMLYPVLNVVMMPLAALLMDRIGVGNILLLQSGLSIAAAVTENGIKIQESSHFEEKKPGFSLWLQDFRDGMEYLKGERGLTNICAYNAVANGAAAGYGPILVAFFRTAPGFTAQMYAYFSVVEFIGRTIGGVYRYRSNLRREKRQSFVYFVQQFYNVMDGILLWLPYPLMLLNRGICGFLGINSATVRESAVQKYLPEEYRARFNAFSNATICAGGSLVSLLLGALGEVMDYRIAMSLISGVCIGLCAFTIWRRRKDIKKIYDVLDQP